jgi:uncharacterized membrane protein
MAEDQDAREILSQLVERLDRLERLLQAQTVRLYAVERRLGIEGEAAPPARRQPLYESLKDERVEASPAPPPAPRAAAPAPPDVQPTRAAEKPRDLESTIGGVWFAWAGILAVVFTVAFVLKSAFENNWVGPGARVALGGLAGAGLLGAGEYLRRRGLRLYAYILSGGGVLSLYLSVYAAYDFYGMLSQPAAFLLMTAVTAGAVLLSVRLGALPVAVLGLVGGFLTPLLLTTGQDNQSALFTYVSLLDAGVLAVGYFKRWRSLDFLSFAATVLMTFVWAVGYYDASKLWTTLLFVTLFFVLYSLLAVFHNVLPRRRSRWFDVALLSANATLYFGASYGMLSGAGYERVLPAGLAVAVAAFFAALFFFARGRWAEDRLLAYAYVGAAVTFLTAAAAIQLELQWVTIVWAVEGLMLTWVGLRSGEGAARRAGLAVFAVAAVHWFAFDVPRFALAAGAAAPDAVGEFVPLVNARALSCLVLVVALASAARLYLGAPVAAARGALPEGERDGAAALCTLAANGLAVTLLTLDLSDYYGRRKALSQGLDAERAENARQFSLTALWSIYGAGLVAYGARRGTFWARAAGLLLLGVAVAKVLAIDLRYYDAVWHAPLLNHTFMAFALVAAGCGAAARLLAREPGVGPDGAAAPALVVVANLLALVALSAEAVGYFEARSPAGADADALRDLALAKQLSLSVVWALYGAGLLLAGRAWRARLLRLLGLGLLALTTLKVFLLDLSALNRAYRIVSFLVLGAILLAVSYLYQRSQQRAASEDV